MTEILSRLFLGGLLDVNSSKFLADHRISGIVSCCNKLDYADAPSGIDQRRIDVEDISAERIIDHLECVISFIDEHRAPGKAVLLHCRSGVSRSATICVGYIMLQLHLSLHDAFTLVIKRRPIVCPNIGFMNQLIELEKAIIEQRQIPFSALEMVADRIKLEEEETNKKSGGMEELSDTEDDLKGGTKSSQEGSQNDWEDDYDDPQPALPHALSTPVRGNPPVLSPVIIIPNTAPPLTRGLGNKDNNSANSPAAAREGSLTAATARERLRELGMVLIQESYSPSHLDGFAPVTPIEEVSTQAAGLAVAGDSRVPSPASALHATRGQLPPTSQDSFSNVVFHSQLLTSSPQRMMDDEMISSRQPAAPSSLVDSHHHLIPSVPLTTAAASSSYSNSIIQPPTTAACSSSMADTTPIGNFVPSPRYQFSSMKQSVNSSAAASLYRGAPLGHPTCATSAQPNWRPAATQFKMMPHQIPADQSPASFAPPSIISTSLPNQGGGDPNDLAPGAVSPCSSQQLSPLESQYRPSLCMVRYVNWYTAPHGPRRPRIPKLTPR